MSDEQSEKPQEPEPEPSPEEPAKEKPEQPVQDIPEKEPTEETQEKPPEEVPETQPVKEKEVEQPKETQDEHEEEPPKEDHDKSGSIEGSEGTHDHSVGEEHEETGSDAPKESPKPEEETKEQKPFSTEGIEGLLSDMAAPTSETQDFVLPAEFLKESAKPKAKTALGSTIDIRRSVGFEGFDKRMARYGNTYRLESNNPFNVETVDKILKATMDDAIANMSYEPEKCLRIAKWASGVIRTKVKEHEFERYKIIAIATIGEKKFQDMMVACRSLWDGDSDKYSFYSTENDKVYAIAMCFGIYYE